MHFSTLFFSAVLLDLVNDTPAQQQNPPRLLSPVTTAQTHTAAHIFIAMPRSKKVLRNTY